MILSALFTAIHADACVGKVDFPFGGRNMRRRIEMLVAVGMLVLAGSASLPASGVEKPVIVPVSPDLLKAAIGSGTWLIVEFGGEHCIPCTHMQPILQDLQVALGKKARVYNFWIQQHPDVARAHRIMVMPTQVIFNPKGEEVFRHMGYFPPEEFHAALQKLGIL
jgi:thiol-disulfide isomerase/thioredoxin